MAALNSTTFTNQGSGRAPIPSGSLTKGTPVVQAVVIAIPNTGAGTALNDTLGLFRVPRGAVLVDGWIDVDDLDSGTTITFDLGDSGSATRFLSASAVAQAGGRANFARGQVGYQFLADTDLFLTVHAAATGKQAGNLAAVIMYTMAGIAGG